MIGKTRKTKYNSVKAIKWRNKTSASCVLPGISCVADVFGLSSVVLAYPSGPSPPEENMTNKQCGQKAVAVTQLLLLHRISLHVSLVSACNSAGVRN